MFRPLAIREGRSNRCKDLSVGHARVAILRYPSGGAKICTCAASSVCSRHRRGHGRGSRDAVALIDRLLAYCR